MGNLSVLGVCSLLEVQCVTFFYKVCERPSQDFLWQCENIAVTDGLHTNGGFMLRYTLCGQRKCRPDHFFKWCQEWCSLQHWHQLHI